MGFFKRMIGIGKSEANAALDSMEDPVKMTEQGIRDLEKHLVDARKGLAQVKATRSRLETQGNTKKAEAKGYEKKAMLLLQKAQDGTMDVTQADTLATSAVEKSEGLASEAASLLKSAAAQKVNEDKLEAQVKKLMDTIATMRQKATTLKARAQTADATSKINKQLSAVDSSSTMAMLERMEDKVAEKEALSEGYAEVAGLDTSLDDELDAAIGNSSAAEKLAAMKKKLAA